MNNPVRYIVGIVLGFVCGAGVFYLIAAPAQEKMLASVRDCTAANVKLQQENIELRAKVDASRNYFQQQFSESTVLYEAVPQSGIATVISMIAGKPLPAQQGMAPKWFIPARVVPIIAAHDAANVRVIYLDKDGRSTPAAPEILPQ